MIVKAFLQEIPGMMPGIFLQSAIIIHTYMYMKLVF